MSGPSCCPPCRAETRPLLVPIDDATAAQVVRRKLHGDLVPGKDLDEMHPHLARDVGQDLVTVLQLHAEHRVRKRLDHGAFDLDAFFFRQSTLSVSPRPTATGSRDPRPPPPPYARNGR